MGAVSENVACLLPLEALCRQPRVTELSCGEPQCSSERSLKTASKEVKDKHLFSAARCSCLSFLCGVLKKTKINSHYQGAKVTKRAIQKDVKRYQIMTSPVANMLSSSILANVQQQQQRGGQHVAGSLDFVFVWRFKGSRQLWCPTRLPQRQKRKKSEAHHGKAVYSSSIQQPQIEFTRTWRVLFAIKYASPHLLRDHIICISLLPEVVTVLIGPRSPNRKWTVGR